MKQALAFLIVSRFISFIPKPVTDVPGGNIGVKCDVAPIRFITEIFFGLELRF
jgi:hypothetical protein